MDLRKTVPAAGSTLYLQDDVEFDVAAPEQVGGFVRRRLRKGVGVAVLIPLMPVLAAANARLDQARGLGVVVTTATGEAAAIADEFLGPAPPPED